MNIGTHIIHNQKSIMFEGIYMKEIIILLVLVFAIFVPLASCSNGIDESDVDSSTKSSIGVIEESVSGNTSLELTSKEIKGFLLESSEMQMPFGNTKSVFSYDEFGRLIETTAFSNSKKYMVETLTYDGNGFLTVKKQQTFNSSGKIISDFKEEFVNSNSGFPISVTTIANDSVAYATYEYDQKNRVLLYLQKDGSGIILDKKVYDYFDNNGSYLYTEINNSTTKHIYDSAGNELEYSVTKSDGSVLVLYQYTYDERNNVIKSIDKDGAICDHINTYDNNGRLQSYAIYNGAELVSKAIFEYDEYGNLLKKEQTNAAGTVESTTINVWMPIY